MKRRERFVVSHLCDKNKDVAKMGHPGFVGGKGPEDEFKV